MFFLKRFKNYSYNKSDILFGLSYKVDKLTKDGAKLYIVYYEDKIIVVLIITYHGQTYDEFKCNRRHGVAFKHFSNEELPSLYATFKYGVLHGWYFSRIADIPMYNDGLRHYNRSYHKTAISALYENGYTEYINCIRFDTRYSLKTVDIIMKYAFSTTRVCDSVAYENLSNQPKFLHGWSKYGDDYRYYQNGKLIKEITKSIITGVGDNRSSVAYEYIIYGHPVNEIDNDAIIYKYLTGGEMTTLEIKVKAKKDSIIKINPVTKEQVKLIHTLVKYTWYKNKLVILMERMIAPNYCTVAKYQCITDHNKQYKQIWTNISINVEDYKLYRSYHIDMPNFIDL